jgi:hypothetical protein
MTRIDHEIGRLLGLEERAIAVVVALVGVSAGAVVGGSALDWFALHVEGDETVLAVRADLLVLRALVLAHVGHALEAGVLHRAVVLSELLSKSCSCLVFFLFGDACA